jgi:hypothetical protein
MVIDVIDIQCFAIGETKHHAPVGADRYGLEALQVALERVQAKTRKVHVGNVAGGVKARDNVAQFLHVFGRDAARIVVIPEAFQSLVTNRTNHDSP